MNMQLYEYLARTSVILVSVYVLQCCFFSQDFFYSFKVVVSYFVFPQNNMFLTISDMLGFWVVNI